MCTRTGSSTSTPPNRATRWTPFGAAPDHIVPEEYTTYFRSVIAFGTVRILEEDGEKRAAIEKLAVKYAPADSRENRDSAIDREWAPLCMLEMEVEHLSGKEAIELVRQRES